LKLIETMNFIEEEIYVGVLTLVSWLSDKVHIVLISQIITRLNIFHIYIIILSYLNYYTIINLKSEYKRNRV